MISNYFKVAWRNLMRYKGFTFINVFGLTLGLVFALIIMLWVQDEIRYNQFHEKIDRLYQVRANLYWSGGDPNTASGIPGPVEAKIEADVPEVELVTKFNNEEQVFSFGETVAKEKGMYVSSGFLEAFSFPLVAGNAETALSDPNSVIISEKMAQKYFGTTDVIGKSIEYDNKKSLLISAVAQNVPVNSSIKFDWLRPFDVFEKANEWSTTWGNFSFQMYVLLKPNADPAIAQGKLKSFDKIKEHKAELLLQPFSDAYLYSKFEHGQAVGGRIEYVRLFLGIALFVLLLACINFMNLATARAAQRAREIGIRKVVGARRSALIGQFMAEPMMVSLLAFFLAIGLANLLLPGFNTLFGKELNLNNDNPLFWTAALALTLITGALAGIYPAIFLSGFKPVNVLKGEVFKMADGSSLLRKGLVVFQFTLSIFLIIGVTVIQQQVDFVRNKNLGIDRKDVVYTILDGKLYEQSETFRQELLASPAISAFTTMSDNPMDIDGSSGDLNWQGKDPNQSTAVSPITVGNDFTKTMGIHLLEGRDFRSYPADSANYLINESAAKLMGMEQPLGQEIEFWMGKGKIIGVVEDFHLRSLHEAITPMVICYAPENTWISAIKPAAGQTEEALAHLEKVAQKLNPGVPPDFRFADDEFEKQYRSETLIGKLANWFAIIAIIISCLGLFGLATYATERRTKEIGVRKVLGAQMSDIVNLLSQDFLRLVFIAILVASPIAWYFMNQWLNDFAYHVHIAWWVFPLAGILAVVIALVTVSFQSIRAALTNPVELLRNE